MVGTMRAFDFFTTYLPLLHIYHYYIFTITHFTHYSLYTLHITHFLNRLLFYNTVSHLNNKMSFPAAPKNSPTLPLSEDEIAKREHKQQVYTTARNRAFEILFIDIVRRFTDTDRKSTRLNSSH